MRREGSVGSDERRSEAALRRQLLERRRGKTAGAGTCKNSGFTWPHFRDDDNDDNGGGDYDHPGYGKPLDDNYWGVGYVVRRDRTRSPPRRDYSAPSGRRHDAAQIQAVFTGTFNKLSMAQVPSSDSEQLDYAARFCRLADALIGGDNPEGNQAWSAAGEVPVPLVFTRLREALRLPPAAAPLPRPSAAEVNDALDDMLMRLPLLNIDAPGGHGALGACAGSGAHGAAAGSWADLDFVASSPVGPLVPVAQEAGLNEDATPAPTEAGRNAGPWDTTCPPVGPAASVAQAAGLYDDAAPAPTEAGRVSAPTCDDDNDDLEGIEALFCTPPVIDVGLVPPAVRP